MSFMCFCRGDLEKQHIYKNRVIKSKNFVVFVFFFLKHQQKHLTNMNSRGVQNSLITKLTILIFLYFNFLKMILFTKISRKVFGKNIIPLSKHLNNITNHWFPLRIKLINPNFCLLLQSFELQPTNYVNAYDLII